MQESFFVSSAKYIPYFGAAGILAAAMLALYFYHTRKMRHGEILRAGQMKAKYGLTADRYKRPHLDPSRVPEHLRDLVAVAEKWGIPDDIMRSDFEEKASDAEKHEFQAQLKNRTGDISEWLDSFEPGKPMPDEAAHFMYMLEALAEMGLWPDPPETTAR